MEREALLYLDPGGAYATPLNPIRTSLWHTVHCET